MFVKEAGYKRTYLVTVVLLSRFNQTVGGIREEGLRVPWKFKRLGMGGQPQREKRSRYDRTESKSRRRQNKSSFEARVHCLSS